MRITSSIVAIASTILVSSAVNAQLSPPSLADGISQKHSVKVELSKKQVKTPDVSTRINHILNKYGVVDETLKMKEMAEVDLESIYVDVEYVGSIKVGTPPVSFNMVLDTGSADIWVPSVPCATCGSHVLFDSKGSTTYKALNETWALGYFDGSYVKGVTGEDVIQVGDLPHRHQVIGLATSESNSFARNANMDGVFGLSFPSISLTHQNTSIIVDMYNAGEIDEPVVGMHLGHTRDGGKGEAIFGGINKEHFTGELEYLPVTRQRYWQVDFGGVEIDGKLHTSSRATQAMIDTGTTLTVLPTSLVRAIHAAIPGGKYVSPYGWFFPCDTVSDTVVTFKLGGKDFPVPIAELIRERYISDDPSLCITGLGESNAGLAILGETFLRNYYSSYNFKTAAVGLAPSRK